MIFKLFNTFYLHQNLNVCCRIQYRLRLEVPIFLVLGIKGLRIRCFRLLPSAHTVDHKATLNKETLFSLYAGKSQISN